MREKGKGVGGWWWGQAKEQPSQCARVCQNYPLPSDTKLLLTKNYSEIIIFVKITNFTRNFLKESLFLEILRVQNASQTTKNNSQGVIFAIISCQRVVSP